jgi:hypothetical protein
VPASTPTPSLDIPLTDVMPDGYDSCLLYALDKRPGLQALHNAINPSTGSAYGWASGPADYIDRGQTNLIEAGTVIESGYAVVWNRGQGYADETYGHIAIVVEVVGDSVYVIDANWGPNAKREISRSDLNGLYVIGRLPGEGGQGSSGASHNSNNPI